MDTSVTTATSSASSLSVGGAVAPASSLASLMPPSSFASLAASGAVGPGGITTLSNSTSGTTTTTAAATVGSSLSGDQQNTIGKDGTVGSQPSATSVSASVAISTTTTSVANSSSSSSTTTTSSTTSLSAAITAAIATVTGTLAVPVSNIGANGVLSTGSGSITTASSSISAATTTSVSSPGAGLPPPTQSKAGVNSDKGGIPKATIKPNVLTHVIEGYVIQEANEPFAVQRQRYPERDSSDEPPKKRSTNEANSPLSPSSAAAVGGSDSGNCEVCGKSELRSKMKRKRFCSVSCARSAKQNSTEQISSPVQNGTVGNGGSALVDTVMNGGGAVATLPTPMVVPGADPSSLNQLAMLGSSPTAVVHSNVKLEMKDAYGQPASQQQQQLPGVLGAANPFAQQQQQQQLLLQQQQSAAATLLTAAAPPLTVGTPPTATGMLLSAGDAPGGPQTPTGLAAAAAAAAAASEENSSILRWTVQDVYEFIRALPGCSDYAEDFVNQEIDGQALLLLKENHLVSTMDMKLGPALKIVARVNLMKTAIAPPEGQ